MRPSLVRSRLMLTSRLQSQLRPRQALPCPLRLSIGTNLNPNLNTSISIDININDNIATGRRSMAGHSHYQNTRHRKAAVDAARSAKLTKAARELYAAVAEGGSDPSANLRLQRALAAARRANMPSSRIARALGDISGSGKGGANSKMEMYEMVLPRGVGMQVTAVPTRVRGLAADLRALAKKAEGELAKGKTQHLFRTRFTVTVVIRKDEQMKGKEKGQGDKDGDADDVGNADELRDLMILTAMDRGATEFHIGINDENENEDFVEFDCDSRKDRDQLASVLRAQFSQLEEGGSIFTAGGVEPTHMVNVADDEHVMVLRRLLDALDEHAEVVDVVHNANMAGRHDEAEEIAQ